MSNSDYNLEDEELYLESYLERATAFGTKRDDSNDNDSNSLAGDAGQNKRDDNDDFIEKRVYCCNTSRSLYCPECCSVLIPKKFWPKRFISQQHSHGRRQQLQSSVFPFRSMDIVLGVKERRTSSTGIQMICISKMISESTGSTAPPEMEDQRLPQQLKEFEATESKIETTTSSSSHGFKNNGFADTDNNGNEWWRNVTLYDLNRGDKLPQYPHAKVSKKQTDGCDEASRSEAVENEGTYVLFPQEGKSVPISSVADKVKRLVVLDIKWTRSYNVQLFSADHHKITVSRPGESGGGKTYNPLSPLKNLPFVHLEFPPQKSNFWRWHNRGDGMLSTIEAIYFAAREVSTALEYRRRHKDKNEMDHEVIGSKNPEQSCLTEKSEDKKDERFVDMLWLFALQRSIIQERSMQEGRPVAFSEEAKALARALRQQNPRTDQ